MSDDETKSVGGSVRTGHFDDIDRQAAELVGYDQSYRQMTRGRFSGIFSSYLLAPDAGIHVEQVNQVMEQGGAVPRGEIGAVFLLSGQALCRMGSLDFAMGDVMLFGEGAEFHFRNALDTVVCVVSLSLDRLAACLPGNKALPARGRSLMLRQSGPAVPALVTTTTEGIAAIKDRNGADIGGLQDRLCAEIEERLVDLIDDRTPRSIRSGPRPPHRQIFDRARHLIEENLARDQPIARLARDVGVSRRMLEYAFHAEVGVGPAHYVQRLRLNAVRHVLATEDVTVGDATARLGIWHLSRFAAQYRDLFGELPSDTLRRTQR